MCIKLCFSIGLVDSITVDIEQEVLFGKNVFKTDKLNKLDRFVSETKMFLERILCQSRQAIVFWPEQTSTPKI